MRAAEAAPRLQWVNSGCVPTCWAAERDRDKVCGDLLYFRSVDDGACHTRHQSRHRMDICCGDEGSCLQQRRALWDTFGLQLLLAKSALLPCDVPINWCRLGSGCCYLRALCVERVGWEFSSACVI